MFGAKGKRVQPRRLSKERASLWSPKGKRAQPRRPQKPRKKKMTAGRLIGNLFLAALISVGVGALLYPTLADMWNQYHQSHAISSYVEELNALDPKDYSALWDEAEQYNAMLLTRRYQFYNTEDDHEWYMRVMNVTSSGMMAYLEIPDIDVNLPVYHTTQDEILQVAVGHMEGSSLPIGGESTHACLSGHTGMTSAKLFDKLHTLTPGSVFYIHVLGETHEYTVTEVNTVLPEDMELLEIVPGEDLCTLITCTPYGVNTHRFLVRGTRTN